MYKVLIVEDEIIFAEHMQKKMDWNYCNCAICGIAHNGNIALELIEYEKPDIVLMDIEIPLINGLDVSEKVLNFSKVPKIIILTAHGEFAFAHKAIKVGVFDYLLKPFNNKKLQDTLLACIKEIEKEKENIRSIEKLQNSEMSKFLINIIKHDIVEENLISMFPKEGKYAVVIIKTHKTNKVEMKDIINRFTFYEVDNSRYESYFIENSEEIIIVHSIKNQSLGICNLKDIYNKVIDYFLHNEKKVIYVSLGTFVNSIVKLKVSYNKAKFGIENRLVLKKYIVTNEDTERLNSDKVFFSSNDTNLLINYIQNDKEKEVEELIEKIFGLEDNKAMSFQYVISVYCMLEINILSYFGKPVSQTEHVTKRENILQELNSCHHIKDIKKLLENDIYEMVSEHLVYKIPKKSDLIVNHIETYIENNFCDVDFSIDKLAKAIFFENSYARRLYKTHMNKTIMKRVEELRIEKSMELLKIKENKVSDIALQVGYADRSYFSKRFKIYQNMTPAEYQIMYQDLKE